MPPLLSRLQAQPQLADVSSDWQDKGLAAYIKVDRDSASRPASQWPMSITRCTTASASG